MVLLDQHDPRWALLKLGTSNELIKDYGCTVTAIAEKFNTTPDVVNNALKAVNGFVNNDLVNWTKIGEALPGTKFVQKYAEYDNNTVLANLPCIVEVDAAPIGGVRHWVLFIGNHQLYDPWDGKVKSTATYKPLSFVILSGEYKEANNDQPIEGCLVPNTPEWRAKYDEIVGKATKYEEFQSHGYISFVQVASQMEDLQRQIDTLKKTKAGDLTQSNVDTLKQEIPSIKKAGDIISAWASRWDQSLAPASKSKKVVVKDTPKTSSGVDFLLDLFDFNKEVKK